MTSRARSLLLAGLSIALTTPLAAQGEPRPGAEPVRERRPTVTQEDRELGDVGLNRNATRIELRLRKGETLRYEFEDGMRPRRPGTERDRRGTGERQEPGTPGREPGNPGREPGDPGQEPGTPGRDPGEDQVGDPDPMAPERPGRDRLGPAAGQQPTLVIEVKDVNEKHITLAVDMEQPGEDAASPQFEVIADPQGNVQSVRHHRPGTDREGTAGETGFTVAGEEAHVRNCVEMILGKGLHGEELQPGSTRQIHANLEKVLAEHAAGHARRGLGEGADEKSMTQRATSLTYLGTKAIDGQRCAIFAIGEQRAARRPGETDEQERDEGIGAPGTPRDRDGATEDRERPDRARPGRGDESDSENRGRVAYDTSNGTLVRAHVRTAGLDGAGGWVSLRRVGAALGTDRDQMGGR